MDKVNIEVWVQFPHLTRLTLTPLVVLEVRLRVAAVVPFVQMTLGWLGLVGVDLG